jgi:primosomal protein N'
MHKLTPLLCCYLGLGFNPFHLQGQETPPPAESAKNVDPEHTRLVAARKSAHELPEVMSAQQQAKADRALAHKAQAEARVANKKAMESEAYYRKCLDEGLAKIDPGARDQVAKEKTTFKEKMSKARQDKKAAKANHTPAPTPEEEKPEPSQNEDGA